MALAAIQGLNEKVESGKQKLESQIEELKTQNTELKAQLVGLQMTVASLTEKSAGGLALNNQSHRDK